MAKEAAMAENLRDCRYTAAPAVWFFGNDRSIRSRSPGAGRRFAVLVALWVGRHAAKRALWQRVSHSWQAVAGVANSVFDPSPFIGLGGGGRSLVFVGHLY